MPRFARSAIGVLLLTAAAAGARAQEPVDASGLPPGVSLSAQSIRTDERDGSIVAEGAVTIESAMGRFQADRVTVRSFGPLRLAARQKTVHAPGHATS